MLNVRLACDHLFGKLLFTWLSLVMSMMVSFVLSFFPRDVLDEILNLIESVSEDFPSYSHGKGEPRFTRNYMRGDDLVHRKHNRLDHCTWMFTWETSLFTFFYWNGVITWTWKQISDKICKNTNVSTLQLYKNVSRSPVLLKSLNFWKCNNEHLFDLLSDSILVVNCYLPNIVGKDRSRCYSTA